MPDTPIDILRTALKNIESGRPAGSTDSMLASDGNWKQYARELQRVARVALREADLAAAGKTTPTGGISA